MLSASDMWDQNTVRHGIARQVRKNSQNDRMLVTACCMRPRHLASERIVDGPVEGARLAWRHDVAGNKLRIRFVQHVADADFELGHADLHESSDVQESIRRKHDTWFVERRVRTDDVGA